MLGIASPANPRRSASAASSRIIVRLVGVPITDRAGMEQWRSSSGPYNPGSVRGRGRIGNGGGRASADAIRLLRVAMVCPYSLSVPGGVQAQVMGLSRELRKMGIEVRVLAPCDGPPPATFVTPLGNSLPTSANGSMAPLAPDPSCSLRTMRALGDEQFDVLHLHEPFTPGPTQTAMLLHPAPVVATFHAAGESAAYRYLKVSIKPAAAQHRPRSRGLQGRCRTGAPLHRRQLRDPLQRCRARRLPCGCGPSDDGADDLLLRAPRGAQGARRPAEGGRATRPRGACVGRQHRARHRTPAGPLRRAIRGSSGSAD